MSNKTKTAVLLVNVGTPDSFEVSDVRKYLSEFLNDKRVIDLHPIVRHVLVNWIIVPFRAYKSAKTYKKLWTANGSPLKYYGMQLAKKMTDALGNGYVVELGMRYQNPSLKQAIKNIMANQVQKIILIPLFPQYASATTGSVVEEVYKQICTYTNIPIVHTLSNYFDYAPMIEAYAHNANSYLEKQKYDHILISFHGIPRRHILKASCGGYCKLNERCCSAISKLNYFCYRAQCHATARAIAQKLNLRPEQYTVVFQSRLGNEQWLEPYAEEKAKSLPSQGIKNVLVVAPSFTADCLETTIEIGHEYEEIFRNNGGNVWQLVHSLNDSPMWVDALKAMVLSINLQASLPTR
jgi:ferrochelatase